MTGNIENLLKFTSDLFRRREMRPLLEHVTGVARYLWERGWAERNAGNFSVNVTEMMHERDFGRFASFPSFPLQKNYPGLPRTLFLVSGSGTRMRDMAASPPENLCFVFVNDTGSAYHVVSREKETPLRPTSELATHLAVQQHLLQKQLPEKVVLHAHVTELIALTQLAPFRSEEAINNLLCGMHPEIALYEPSGVGFIPYTLAGTEQMAVMTRDKLEHHRAVIWEKHGLLATGKSLPEAFDTIDIVAKAARIWFLCRSAGMDPEGLTTDQLREIRERP